MNFFIGILQGMILGAGCIAPGLSGGTLAVVIGLYARLTDTAANFFRDFRRTVKEKFFFLLPLGIGGVIGVILLGQALSLLYDNFPSQTMCVFIGLMAGTFPNVAVESVKQGFRKVYLLPFVLSFALSILLMFLPETGVASGAGFLQFVFYGAVIGFGTIVPGISSSFLLIYFGGYKPSLDALAKFDVALLIPLGIGAVVTALLLVKVVDVLYKKAYGVMSFLIMGFVFGSLFVMFTLVPAPLSAVGLTVDAVLVAAGFAASFVLCKFTVKRKV